MYRILCLTLIICFSGCASQKNNTSARDAKPAVSIKNISGSAVEIAEREISLGVISPQQSEIKGIIPIFNPGTEVLEIKKVNGPCACFKGSSGDKTILPGQGGEIEARFDPAKIPTGIAKRLVRIETNDPNQPTTEVYFTFDIQRSPEQEQNRLLLTELTQLRSEVKALRRDVDQLKNPTSKQQPCQAQKAKIEDTRIYEIPVGDSPVLGSKDAAVTIVEFSDFQCPYCVKEYAALKQIMDEYPGKVRLVFKHFPLGFHKQAPAVGAMMALAFRQKGNDTFWKLHEMIMAEPKRLDSAALKIYAQALGMDTAELDKVWADEKAMAELLKADKELAAKCNVGGTPTIFINGLKLADRSLDGYRGRINQILSSQGNVVSRAK
jgi:protein-disulfide isomerase